MLNSTLAISLIHYTLTTDSWMFTLDPYTSSLLSPIPNPYPLFLIPGTVPFKKIKVEVLHFSSIEGCLLPLKVFFPQRSSSIKGCLPPGRFLLVVTILGLVADHAWQLWPGLHLASEVWVSKSKSLVHFILADFGWCVTIPGRMGGHLLKAR